MNDQVLTTEIPCPPLHVLPWKTMFEPLLIAKQSSCNLFKETLEKNEKNIKYLIFDGRVLDNKVSCATVKTIRIVTRRLTVTFTVWEITLGYGKYEI